MSDITQKWVNLIVPFTTGYSQKLSGSELSRLSGVPQQTASRYLAELVKQNLLKSERQGQNKLFFLDLHDSAVCNLLQIIENHKSLEFKQKVNEAAVLVEELSNNAESIILFGSYSAYKFNKESDIDLIVVGNACRDEIKTLKRKHPVTVNEQYVSYKELSESLKSKNPLAIEIQKNHIFFGDISRLVRLFTEAVL